MNLPRDYIARMKRILGDEYEKYAAATDEVPCRAFHVNTKKSGWKTLYEKSDIFGELIPYTDNGFLYNGGAGIGFTPAHHSGLVYMQEPSAMLAVSACDCEGAKYILDLCAAPGGKSSQLASKMTGGVLFANETVPDRAQILARNIERMGYRNVVVTRNSPEDYANKMPEFFDIVLVDAPCSGEGMMRKEPEAVSQWSPTLVSSCAARQKNILDSAHIALKEGGIIVYSTCTFSTEENEEIGSYMVSEYGYEVMPVNATIKEFTRAGVAEFCKGFDRENVRRFYPYLGSGEGQSFAVLRKPDEGGKTFGRKFKACKTKKDKATEEFIGKYTNIDCKDILFDGKYYFLPAFGFDAGLNVIFDGVRLGESDGKRFIPHHHFFSALPEEFIIRCEADDKTAERYLAGLETENANTGWGVYTYCGAGLGGFKASGGVAKNHYPKGLRNTNYNSKKTLA